MGRQARLIDPPKPSHFNSLLWALAIAPSGLARQSLMGLPVRRRDSAAQKEPMKTIDPSNDNCFPTGYVLTGHAQRRMTARRLNREAVSAALEYGRVVFVRGAHIFAIGRNEVQTYALEGIDLTRFEGVQVVCTSDGTVLTAYRNRDFRGLRPARKGRFHRQAA